MTDCSSGPVTGSSGLSRRWTHSCITCTSRSSPRRRKRRLPAFFMSFQLGSGSMAAMPSAMEQQRRRATRRSCTGSGAKLRLARSHSSRTRCIQKARPDFFLAGFVGMGKGMVNQAGKTARHSMTCCFRPFGAVSFLARYPGLVPGCNPAPLRG